MTALADQPGDGAEGTSFDMPRARWIDLFAEVAAGSARALEELYDAAADRLYGLAVWASGSPDDAADLVSDVFVKLAEQGERLRKVRDPRAWLLTVAHRMIIDQTRRRRRRKTYPLDTAELLAAPGRDPDRQLDARLASTLLRRLPAPQREVVYLRSYAELSFAAIGRITGVPTFTAASRYRLALRRLRLLMEERP